MNIQKLFIIIALSLALFIAGCDDMFSSVRPSIGYRTRFFVPRIIYTYPDGTFADAGELNDTCGQTPEAPCKIHLGSFVQIALVPAEQITNPRELPQNFVLSIFQNNQETLWQCPLVPRGSGSYMSPQPHEVAHCLPGNGQGLKKGLALLIVRFIAQPGVPITYAAPRVFVQILK